MGGCRFIFVVPVLILWPGDVSLGRYNKNPRMRVQKAENVNKALEFINSRGVKLTNIGPEGTYYNHVIRDTCPYHLLSYRYYRWESKAYSWYDMDSYPAVHYSGHQVYHIKHLYTSPLLNNFIL